MILILILIAPTEESSVPQTSFKDKKEDEDSLGLIDEPDGITQTVTLTRRNRNITFDVQQSNDESLNQRSALENLESFI